MIKKSSLCILLVIIMLSACQPDFSGTQPKRTKTLVVNTTDVPPTKTVYSQTIIQPPISSNLDASTTPPYSSSLVSPVIIHTVNGQSMDVSIDNLFVSPLICEAPCFLGITPGVTKMDEIRAFFESINLSPYEGFDKASGRNFYTITYKTTGGSRPKATFFATGNKVESMFISPDIIKQENGEVREWMAYSPETLINQFGSPSSVMISLDRGPNYVITLTMNFEKLDFSVQYTGYNMYPDRPDRPELCPLQAAFDGVELWIGSPRPNPPFGGMTIDEVTSLTTEQFSKLMVGDKNAACFVINGDKYK
jgi:hypothetical protein